MGNYQTWSPAYDTMLFLFQSLEEKGMELISFYSEKLFQTADTDLKMAFSLGIMEKSRCLIVNYNLFASLWPERRSKLHSILYFRQYSRALAYALVSSIEQNILENWRVTFIDLLAIHFRFPFLCYQLIEKKFLDKMFISTAQLNGEMVMVRRIFVSTRNKVTLRKV